VHARYARLADTCIATESPMPTGAHHRQEDSALMRERSDRIIGTASANAATERSEVGA
jgi:hypothetical protein